MPSIIGTKNNQGPVPTETPAATPDIDVDGLLQEIEGQGQEQEAAQTPTPQQVQEYEFTAMGKPVKAPIDKILRWASAGYGAPQRISQAEKQAREYQDQLKSFEDQRTRYGEVDEYVKQNPDFWDHVTSSYQQRLQQAQNQGAISPELAQKIQGIEKTVNQFQQEKQQEQYRTEDAELNKQIHSIREKYSANFDWETPNEQGLNLENQVIKHGIENGFKDFDRAFRDFKFDELHKQAEDRGRESLAKERQKQTKLGLLGTTPVPTKGLSNVQNIKSKSYDQLMQEGLDELGISLGG